MPSPLQAYILKTDRLISPFGRPAAELKIHNETLAVTQRRSLERLGCRVNVIDDVSQVVRLPALVISDDLYATHHALARFIQAARRRPGENVRAAVAKSPLTEHAATAFQGPIVLDDNEKEHRAYDCFFFSKLDRHIPLDQQATILPLPHRIAEVRTRTNRRFAPSGRYNVPVSLVYMLPIRHWACLVTANMLGMPSFFVRTARERWAASALLPLRMLLSTLSLRPARLAGRLYLHGGKCQVHPSAQVEGAVLGRWVRIGANAIVRNSVLGDHVEVRSGTLVEGCTFGDRVIVESNSIYRGSIAFEGAGLSARYLQTSVVGEYAVMAADVGIADFTLYGTVPVQFEGRQLRSGSQFLGGCVGDNAFLGAGILMSCGREVPSGCVIVTHPDQTLTDVSGDLPASLIRLDRGRKKSKNRDLPPRRKSA